MSDTSHDRDFQGSLFGLEIDNVKMGYFTGCSGIGFDMEVIKHKAVSETSQQTEHKLPGRVKYTEIVFKRGVTANEDLFQWAKTIADGGYDYRTAAIVIYDRDLTPLTQFKLDKVWPSKVSVSDLKTDSDEVMIEEITLQHELLEWEDV